MLISSMIREHGGIWGGKCRKACQCLVIGSVRFFFSGSEAIWALTIQARKRDHDRIVGFLLIFPTGKNSVFERLHFRYTAAAYKTKHWQAYSFEK